MPGRGRLVIGVASRWRAKHIGAALVACLALVVTPGWWVAPASADATSPWSITPDTGLTPTTPLTAMGNGCDSPTVPVTDMQVALSTNYGLLGYVRVDPTGAWTWNFTTSPPLALGDYTMTVTAFCQDDHGVLGGAQATPIFTYATQVVLYFQQPQSRIVALGDSYMSGEGTYPAVDYYPETATLNDTCHRSPASAAVLLGVTPDNFKACSGSTIYLVEHGAKTEPSQLAVLTGSPVSVVLLSVSGNDAGLEDVLKACIHVPGLPKGTASDCRAQISTAESKLPQISQDLGNLYQQIEQLAPGATIVQEGYPHFFPLGGSGSGCNWITPYNQRQMNGAADQLNQMISDTAAGYSYVRYVDITGLFAGHELCGSKTPWINDLQVDVSVGPFHHTNCPDTPAYVIDGFICTQSFHPNVDGYAAEAQNLQPLVASLTGG